MALTLRKTGSAFSRRRAFPSKIRSKLLRPEAEAAEITAAVAEMPPEETPRETTIKRLQPVVPRQLPAVVVAATTLVVAIRAVAVAVAATRVVTRLVAERRAAPLR